jgi:two-component system cell cycle response regulator
MTIAGMNNCLMIGTPEGLIRDGRIDCRICQNIVEGLAVAKQNRFDRIFIVFSDLPEPKVHSLKALCQVSSDSEFILLAMMYEETEVIETLRRSSIRNIDYLVAPLNQQQLSLSLQKKINPSKFSEDEKDQRIRELETLVLQDDLTGLKNRRYLRHFLPAILAEAKQSDFQVSLLLFDIDDFKHYNDSYGHSVGDQVLRQTASLIRCCCRTQDVVARLGGDEFAVVFWDKACLKKDNAGDTENEKDRRSRRNHPREAIFMAERFRREMSAASFDVLGVKGKGALTISGGLATFPTDAATAESLFEKADEAMFEAKRSGKNRLYLVGGPAVTEEH